MKVTFWGFNALQLISSNTESLHVDTVKVLSVSKWCIILQYGSLPFLVIPFYLWFHILA